MWGLRKLGIDTLQAILMTRMGDRYMVIAHNPIVKKAISKEKLTKRGLVSLSDYYLKVAVVSFELNRRIPNGTYGGVRG